MWWPTESEIQSLQQANLSVSKEWRGDECDVGKMRNPMVGMGARMTGKQEVRRISHKRSRSNLRRLTSGNEAETIGTVKLGHLLCIFGVKL
jgi:hypothetical protein